MSRVQVDGGSVNVLEDLGFSPGEGENLQLCANLISKLRAEVRDMAQAQAAKRFAVTEPRINDLIRGKIDKFSIDALVKMSAAAGLRVEIRVKKAS
jgi:predicted XRE-type DNA-binding protein